MTAEPDGRRGSTRAPDSGAEVLASMRGRPGSEVLDSNPQLRSFFECWLDTFIFKGHVDPHLRELAILRVMWRCGQSFEWANHYRVARTVGLTPEEIVAVRTTRPEHDLAADVATVVRAADDVVDRGHLSPSTYAAVSELFLDPGVRHEFLYLVAGYRMFASVSATEGTTAEGRGLPLWPPDGVGPAGPG
ncbi:MAG TPA: carboxymuconolactone decarboxylase family protein [Acidimicrobiales bacterium]|nr:carboxymuconolactone decarboxylase family protein [Acidimicrobiales bacterium]